MAATSCGETAVWQRFIKRITGFEVIILRNRPTLTEKFRDQRGFTLIEIMVVVVILSILAAIIVPRIVKAKQDIRVIDSALKLYKLDNHFYPSTDQGLEALVTKPTTSPEPKNWKDGGYLERLPKDPWDNNYLYLNPGVHGEIDIYSLGADGQPGGEGINADIGNWLGE
jgi:general secretion pathway protein G